MLCIRYCLHLVLVSSGPWRILLLQMCFQAFPFYTYFCVSEAGNDFLSEWSSANPSMAMLVV